MKKPGLLFLTSRFPYPLEKGDKLRAYHLIRHLSRNFDVYLFAINEQPVSDSQLAALQPWCAAIETATISKAQSAVSMSMRHHLPFQIAYFYTNEAMNKLERFANTVQPDAIFCHLIRMAEYACRIPAKVKALDYMDAFAVGMERFRESSSWWMKGPAHIEYKRLRRYENKAFGYFNYHTIISEQDKGHIEHPLQAQIDVVPNGVDFDFFHPMEAIRKYDILFTGHLSYPPNIASAVYTAQEIFPLLQSQRPRATCLIAGAEPVQKVKSLEGNGITIKGWMDDIREAFAHSRVMVAPMLISIGLQNKILQAMIMKIPCVISPMANNALGARHGEHLFVAETPEEYRDYILRLLNDQELYQQLSESGYQYIREHFSWEHHTDTITQRILGLLTH